MSEDLYGHLGLSKGASESEIKKAYRQMARKYHPDVNKEPGADQKFKDIQKAYGILSDPQKKAQYDQFGVTDDSPGAGGFGGGGFGFEGFNQGFGGFSDSFDDIFDVFFGRGARGPRRGDDLQYDLHISLEDAATGLKKQLDIFHMVPGSNGLEKQRKKIDISIPAGVDTGVKLRVSGEGNHGPQGGPPGDLYVVVRVKPHEYFVRDENNIILEVGLPFTQLVLGAEIEVPTLDGKSSIKIPAGTQADTVFRLKGKGIQDLRGYGQGDQFVKIRVELPKKLSSKEKDLFNQLADLEDKKNKKSSIFDFIKRSK